MENAKEYFEEIKKTYIKMQKDAALLKEVEKTYGLIRATINNDKKILIFGNGGSAADSQHFAAELVGRFERKRSALPAIALTTDTSIITSYANDCGFEHIFARQIEAIGEKGDLAIGFTTSDASSHDPHSKNIYLAFLVARKKKMGTAGFVSIRTKNLLSLLDAAMKVPHENTAIIQGCHQSIFHYLCKKIDAHFIDMFIRYY